MMSEKNGFLPFTVIALEHHCNLQKENVRICSLCNLVILRFGFENWIWVLIASLLDLCLLFTVKLLFL